MNALSSTDIEFFLIAEKGDLELQAALLCESIRMFTGCCRFASITVVSPRRHLRPSSATWRKLELLGVEYLELDLQSRCAAYGPSFKVQVAAYLERRAGPPVLVQLDSDTLFVGEPDLSPHEQAAAARPVDVKGMCTAGTGDAFDPYWQQLCRVCGVNYEALPLIETTVDRVTVRASFNGGLVAVPRASRIFAQTEMFFDRGVEAGLKPWAERGSIYTGAGEVPAEGGEYWGSSQAALSLAIAHSGGRARILPASHNVPLHFFDSLAMPQQAPVHLHYHWLLSGGEHSGDALFDPRLMLAHHTVEWLRRRVPLC